MRFSISGGIARLAQARVGQVRSDSKTAHLYISVDDDSSARGRITTEGKLQKTLDRLRWVRSSKLLVEVEKVKELAGVSGRTTAGRVPTLKMKIPIQGSTQNVFRAAAFSRIYSWLGK
jgi:hypothetical protein